MRLHTNLAFFLLFSAVVYGDDLDPPVWRGTEGSTFQQWDFYFTPGSTDKQYSSDCTSLDINKTPWGQRGQAEIINNPYQEQSGVCVEYKTLWAITDEVEWLKEHNGRAGVWQLNAHNTDFNFINFTIPNLLSRTKKHKEIHVQITYESLKLPPVVKLLILPQGESQFSGPLQPVEEYSSGVLPRGWRQRTYKFRLDLCPRFESVQVFSPKKREIFIDKVAVDTVCHN